MNHVEGSFNCYSVILDDKGELKPAKCLVKGSLRMQKFDQSTPGLNYWWILHSNQLIELPKEGWIHYILASEVTV